MSNQNPSRRPSRTRRPSAKLLESSELSLTKNRRNQSSSLRKRTLSPSPVEPALKKVPAQILKELCSEDPSEKDFCLEESIEEDPLLLGDLLSEKPSSLLVQQNQNLSQVVLEKEIPLLHSEPVPVPLVETERLTPSQEEEEWMDQLLDPPQSSPHKSLKTLQPDLSSKIIQLESSLDEDEDLIDGFLKQTPVSEHQENSESESDHDSDHSAYSLEQRKLIQETGIGKAVNLETSQDQDSEEEILEEEEEILDSEEEMILDQMENHQDQSSELPSKAPVKMLSTWEVMERDFLRAEQAKLSRSLQDPSTLPPENIIPPVPSTDSGSGSSSRNLDMTGVGLKSGDPMPEGVVSEEPVFQFNGLALFVTFPQCDVKKEQVLANCRALWGVFLSFAVIAEELHKDGTPHLHAYIKFKCRKQFSGGHFADFLVRTSQNPSGKHGNYRKVMKPEGCFRYVTKGGNFLVHGRLPKKWKEIMEGGTNSSKKKKISLDDLCQLILDGTPLSEIMVAHPGKFMLYKKRLEDYEQAVLNVPKDLLKWNGVDENPSYLEEEIASPQLRMKIRKIFHWINLNIKQKRTFRQQQLYIYGPGGIGKTSLFEWLDKYLKIYNCPTQEQWYCKFSNDVNLIRVDEFDGSGAPIGFWNSLLSGEKFELKKKGVSGFTKQGYHPVMICSNLSPEECYKKLIDQGKWMQFNAFKSRLLIIDLMDVPQCGEQDDGTPMYPCVLKLFESPSGPLVPKNTSTTTNENRIPSARSRSKTVRKTSRRDLE